MNPAVKLLEDWAEIAGIINSGWANVFVTGEGRIVLAVHLGRLQAERLQPWLESKGRRFRVDFGRNRDRVRFRFMGAEAVKVLNQTYDRLRDPSLKERAGLATRYWRTIRARGIRLGVDQRDERLAVLLDFETLKQLPELG